MTIFRSVLFFFLLLLALIDPLFAEEKGPDIIAGPVLHLATDGLWIHLTAKGLKVPVVEWKLAGGANRREPLKKIGKNSWVSSAVSLTVSPKGYRISDGSWSSPPYDVGISPSRDGSFSLAVYGDNRSGSGDELVHRLLIKKIIKAEPDLVLHTGDLVVNADRTRHWRDFFGEIGPLASRIPFMPSKGNHDTSRRDRYEEFFPIANGKSYYTFDYQGVTFIALDTYINFHKGSPQHRFAEKILRSRKPDDPVIVFFHAPPFSYAEHGSDKDVRKHLVPLFSRYGVDLVLTGHEHGYQRMAPVDGVPYIIAAGGGAPLYAVSPGPALKNFRVVYNVVFITIDGAAGSPRRRLKGVAVNVQGGVEDRFEIQL